MKHASEHPEVLCPGTLEAIAKLRELELLDTTDTEEMAGAYRFLRGVEARLRLMNTSKRHDLPATQQQRQILAFLLGRSNGDNLEKEVRQVSNDNRRRFERFFT
jgi:glutamate-ammonia-ligase adenylyltransferase